jgi:hypothetical protein
VIVGSQDLASLESGTSPHRRSEMGLTWKYQSGLTELSPGAHLIGHRHVSLLAVT